MADFNSSLGDDDNNNNINDEQNEIDPVLDEDNISSVYENQRDAVLFMVDCRSSMFTYKDKNDGDNKNNDNDNPSSSSSSKSPFSAAMQCCLDFYQNKIITSPRDLVGLVLYNTREANNNFSFQNLFVFHHLDYPSPHRIGELRQLVRSGKHGTKAALEFEEYLGYVDRKKRPVNKAEGAEIDQSHLPETSLSNALWAALHIHNAVANSVGKTNSSSSSSSAKNNNNNNNNQNSQQSGKNSQGISFKRVLLWTDDDSPHHGSAAEFRKCSQRLKDLCEQKIGLSVFAHGKDVTQQVMNNMNNNITGINAATAGAIIAGGINKNNNNKRDAFAKMTAPSSSTAVFTNSNNTRDDNNNNNNPNNMMMMNNNTHSNNNSGAMAGAAAAAALIGSSSFDKQTTTSANNNNNNNNNSSSSVDGAAPSTASFKSSFNGDKFWNTVLSQARRQEKGNRNQQLAAMFGGNNNNHYYQNQSSSVSQPGSQNTNNNNNNSTNNDLLLADDNLNNNYEIKIDDYVTSFDSFIDEVRVRVHPKRSLGTLRFVVGPHAGRQKQNNANPRCVVALYAPILRCTKPSTTWLEQNTNNGITSEVETRIAGSLEDVAAQDCIRAVQIGASSSASATTLVKFNDSDVKQTKTLSAPAGAGVTILQFKPEDWLPTVKWTVRKSVFLHPHQSMCDNEGREFFACLWRCLVDKKLVAIAEIVARANVEPRLCCLIPATPENTMKEAVTGSGFHVKILPYSEEYRGDSLNLPEKLPNEDSLDDTEKQRLIQQQDRGTQLFQKFIDSFIVGKDFSLSRIANPALQQLYTGIQELAAANTGGDDDDEGGDADDDDTMMRRSSQTSMNSNININDNQQGRLMNATNNNSEDNNNSDDNISFFGSTKEQKEKQALSRSSRSLAPPSSVYSSLTQNNNNNNNNNMMMMMMNSNTNNNTIGNNEKKTNMGTTKTSPFDFGVSRTKYTSQHMRYLGTIKDQVIYDTGYDANALLRTVSGGSSSAAAKAAPTDDELAAHDWQDLNENNKLGTFTLPTLKGFLKMKNLSQTGKKDELIKRISDYLNATKQSGQRRQRDE